MIAALDKQAAKQAAAAEADRKAAEAAAGQRNQPVVPEVPEANQLVASAPFSVLQGQVALPVTGRIKRRFGADDGSGGTMYGDMVATQSGAIVTAPADGSVLYAGPFRSYGQLLILNAGDGYHVVLAGMSKSASRRVSPFLQASRSVRWERRGWRAPLPREMRMRRRSCM